MLDDLVGRDGLAARIAIDIGLDHALVDQPAERFFAADVAQVVQHLVPEPRIQQVQHRVLDATNIEVDSARISGPLPGPGDGLRARTHPVALDLGVNRQVLIGRVEIAQVIPTGPRPVGHRVRVPAVGLQPSALPQVQLDLDPVVCTRQGRLGHRVGILRVEGARAVVRHLRQLDGKHRVGHGVRDSIGVPDDGERLAPVALTTEQPVTQSVGHGGRAAALGHQPRDHPLCGLGDVEAIQADLSVGRVDRWALTNERLVIRVICRRLHRPDDRKAIGHREVPVTLILPWDSHDRAGAVAHQHVVCDEHRDLRAVDRVGHKRSCEDARLGSGVRLTF